MRRSTSHATTAQPELPFVVRHLPFILVLLFIAALHQPIARGLAPQIEYVSALLDLSPSVTMERQSDNYPLLDAQPSQPPSTRFISI